MADEIQLRNEPTLGHVGPLDGFRAIAILLVLIAHAGLGSIVPGGFGVTIFFFLSGFLITSLLRSELSKTHEISLFNFYRKRFFRIIPPLYITLVFCVILIGSGAIKVPAKPGGYLLDILFLTNYDQQFGSGPGFPMPLWSLDVEEHFYMMMPLIYATLAIVLRRQPIPFFAAACVTVLAIRLYNAFYLGVLDENYYWTHTRIDSILFGCLLAMWNNPLLDGAKAWKPKPAHFIIACGVLVLCLAIRSPLFRETLRYTLQGAALLVVFSYILQSRDGPIRRTMSSLPLRLVALWSYTLYLVHIPLFLVVNQNFPTLSPLVASLLALAASVAYAIAMRMFVEKPLLSARKRRLEISAVPDVARSRA